MSDHPLAGRTVLDAGAGTGVASTALTGCQARPLAMDLSFDMLSHLDGAAPPRSVADITALPLGDSSVDDAVASFVLNHLTQPEDGLAELVRAVRPGGAVLATVYSNSSRSAVRDRIDATAIDAGWQVPQWYTEIKARVTPLLGTAPSMEAAARASGLASVVVDERPVDVGVTEPEQLVDYRFGQAQFGDWLNQIGAEQAEAIRARVIDAIRPIMEPYRPVVVFLAGLAPD